METMLVRNLMTPKPFTIPVGAPLLDALLLMRKEGIRHLPVVDDDQLVGILSDRDILLRITQATGEQPDADAEPLNLLVEEVMTRTPITVYETDDVAQVADLMISERIGAIPVVDHAGAVRGIVSTIDLMVELVHRLRAGGKGAK
jgi:acetoin utilization protein AcuB